LPKSGLGDILGDFFTNSSGHPGCLSTATIDIAISANHNTFQGCQMVYFQTKNPNLGKFWRALSLENLDNFFDHLEHFTDSLDIL
jgi:hypothetical protein